MKKIFLLLSFIVFTVFISCQTEPEPEIFTGVDSITIVNKSDTKLTIESVETFESYGRSDSSCWMEVGSKGKRIDEITVNYVLSPGQSKTIEFPYEYTIVEEKIEEGEKSVCGGKSDDYTLYYDTYCEYINRVDLVKLNCTYGDNMYPPFAWEDRINNTFDDFDPDAADNPLLSERYLYLNGSVSLEFKSYTDSKFKTVYCLVLNK